MSNDDNLDLSASHSISRTIREALEQYAPRVSPELRRRLRKLPNQSYGRAEIIEKFVA